MYRDIQSLNNLLESIFQMKITSYKEPILLIGPPTCYKTFVANIILESATIVSLNRESTVLQLLGSPFFFSKDEHRAFCITQIYSILGLANVKTKLNECKDWDNNKKEFKKYIDNLIKNNKIYSDLKIELVKNISKKLFAKDVDENRLIDLKMDFKPGLILNSIFTDKSLISFSFKFKVSFFDKIRHISFIYLFLSLFVYLDNA